MAEKGPKDVHIDNVAEAEVSFATADTRIDGEVFTGINKQTILAFLVSLCAPRSKKVITENNYRLFAVNSMLTR